MNVWNHNNLLTFFNNYQSLKLASGKLQTILNIEGFQKLEIIFFKKTEQNKNFCFIKLKKYNCKKTKWRKQLISQSLKQIDNNLNFKNSILFKESFLNIFYIFRKYIISKHLDYKLLKNDDNYSSNNFPHILKALMIMQKLKGNQTRTRNLAIKYFNRWNYM